MEVLLEWKQTNKRNFLPRHQKLPRHLAEQAQGLREGTQCDFISRCSRRRNEQGARRVCGQERQRSEAAGVPHTGSAKVGGTEGWAPAVKPLPFPCAVGECREAGAATSLPRHRDTETTSPPEPPRGLAPTPPTHCPSCTWPSLGARPVQPGRVALAV